MSNTIIFTISRMNPPTPGHMELIKFMIWKALELDENEIFIILSKSFQTNDKKNPIICDKNTDPESNIDKLTILQQMVEKTKLIMYNETLTSFEKREKILDIKVNLICFSPEQRIIFEPLLEILQNRVSSGSEIKMLAIVGDDRKNIDKQIETFIQKSDKISDRITVEGIYLDRPGMGNLKNLPVDQLAVIDLNYIPTSQFSSTFVRNLVIYGLYDKFEQIYHPYLNHAQILQIYEIIKNDNDRIIPTSSSKKRAASPNRKNTKKGGRKTIRRIRKRYTRKSRNIKTRAHVS